MFHLQLTLFLLLVIGFVCARQEILTQEGRKGLTALTVNVLLPCSIIRSFQIPFDASVLKNMGIILVIGFAYEFATAAMASVLYPRTEKGKRACLGYGLICSNAGFMGQPIAESVLGQEAMVYASVILLPIRIFMWSSGVAMFTTAGQKDVMKKVLTHPCIVAVGIGMILMIAPFPLPSFLDDAMKYAGSCTTALSMIVIGAILAQVEFGHMEGIKMILSYSALRLLAIPLSLYLILYFLHIDKQLIDVAVLMAAMPAGSTTAMLAGNYNGDEMFASGMVFVSTLLSMMTLPLISLLF